MLGHIAAMNRHAFSKSARRRVIAGQAKASPCWTSIDRTKSVRRLAIRSDIRFKVQPP